AQPLLPVTKKDITWKVCFPPIAEGVWEEMQRSENKKLFNRCIALIQAIQTNERMGCVETLSHVCLADGSPIMTRRVTIADRMVYSLSGTDNDKVLTIYGLMTHDETIDKMIRSGIARNK
ncbi:MAG: hypothetical protein Q8K36_04625, partial [Alphaproteobacteria bacterium]|nr:hypothetical protein [Alphaproteobacteria bacterium]